jgi:hypothetical protein
MREFFGLVRGLVVVAIVVVVGWMLWRSVSVESTPEKFEITVDKQQLKAAGRQAAEKGRDAVGEAGKLIKRSGEQLENLDESAPSTRN